MSLPEIKECENENPDQIDEVPVEPHGLDHFVALWLAGHETWTLLVHVAPQHFDRDDNEKQHPDRDVGSMKSRDHEKDGAKLRRTHRVRPRSHPLAS